MLALRGHFRCHSSLRSVASSLDTNTHSLNGGYNLQNAECRTRLQFLGQRKYIQARLKPNPNPIAKHKPYFNPKITHCSRRESFYGLDYRKVGHLRFSADLAYCSRVLHSAFCIQHSATDYTRPSLNVSEGMAVVTEHNIIS